MLQETKVKSMLIKAEKKLEKAVAKKEIIKDIKGLESDLGYTKGQIKRLKIQIKLLKHILEENKNEAVNITIVMLG